MRYFVFTLSSCLLSISSFAIGVITGTRTMCAGATTVLADASPGGAWSSANTATATVGSSTGIVTGVAAGTTIISYSIGAAHATTVVTVNASPDVYTVNGGGSYCADSPGVHIFLSGSGIGINYLLTEAASASGYFDGTGAPIDFGVFTVPGTYTVLATNTVTNCTAPMHGSVLVNILPLVTPLVSFTSAPGDSICPGTAVTLNASAANQGSTPIYLWKVNGTGVAYGTSYNFIPANGDVVTLRLTSNVHCPTVDTATAVDTFRVLPYGLPNVNVTVDPGDTICQYYTATFTATPLFGGYTPIYDWKVNGTSHGGGPVLAYAPVNGDVVVCNMTSDYLCRMTSSASSLGITMTVKPLLLPDVQIVAHPGLSIYAGESDTLEAIVATAGPSPTYQWQRNGFSIAGATNSIYYRSTFADNDSITCKVTSDGLCGGITTFNWVYITIIDSGAGVKPLAAPGADFTLFPNPNNGGFTIHGATGTNTDDAVTIEITGVTGQMVYNKKSYAKQGTVDEQIALDPALADGLYIVTIHTATGTKAFHFALNR